MASSEKVEECSVAASKAKAKERAIEAIREFLKTPKDLDRVDQMMRRISRNKSQIDTRVRTALQAQFDDIRSGMSELQKSAKEVSDIKCGLAEISRLCAQYEDLSPVIENLDRCHSNFLSCFKSSECFTRVFNVPDDLKVTKELLSEGAVDKLLEIHKRVRELEAIRDELLIEYKKMARKGSTIDLKSTPIYQNFADVEMFSAELGKLLWVVVKRALDVVVANPEQLVSTIRIIEREEQLDQWFETQAKETGYMPPDRPKRWRDRFVVALSDSVANRFESNQVELMNKDSDEFWLVKHLERMRSFVLHDLLVAKHLISVCFPKHYRIFDSYLQMYHQSMSAAVAFLLSQNLDSNGHVSLLMWIAEYFGEELLGHPKLDIDRSQVSPLVTDDKMEEMLDNYTLATRKKIGDWMLNIVGKEVKDWASPDCGPDQDLLNLYTTSLVVILVQMLEQNLQLASKLGKQFYLNTFIVCVQALKDFADAYRQAITTYVHQYFQDRSRYTYYVEYMIAAANNCIGINQHLERIKDNVLAYMQISGLPSNCDMHSTVTSQLTAVASLCCEGLFQAVCKDLEPIFVELLTPKWLKSLLGQSIAGTVADYNRDFSHLHHGCYRQLMKMLFDRFVLEYAKAVFARRPPFKDSDERRAVSELLITEMKQLTNVFQDQCQLAHDDVASADVILDIVKVIKSTDSTLISLDLTTLAKYPDFSREHAQALMVVRGDIGRSEVKQHLADLNLADHTGEYIMVSSTKYLGIFSQISIPTHVTDNINSILGGLIRT